MGVAVHPAGGRHCGALTPPDDATSRPQRDRQTLDVDGRRTAERLVRPGPDGSRRGGDRIGARGEVHVVTVTTTVPAEPRDRGSTPAPSRTGSRNVSGPRVMVRDCECDEWFTVPGGLEDQLGRTDPAPRTRSGARRAVAGPGQQVASMPVRALFSAAVMVSCQTYFTCVHIRA